MKNWIVGIAVGLALAAAGRAEPDNVVALDIRSSREHQRNSEGAFATLKSGRIIFYFAQFTNGDTDFSTDRVMECHSDDQGRTWSAPAVKFEPAQGRLSLMCMNLLRLDDGRLAFLCGQKTGFQETRPVIRYSSDEAKTWTEPRYITDVPGYYCINNDRLIQTSTGRLILAIDWDRIRSTENRVGSLDERGLTMWMLSDDRGATWREAKTWWGMPVASENGLQEPGVVELADGSLFSWARTDVGTQFEYRSQDGGEHWTPPQPGDLISTLGPASIKRLPGSSTLLAVFNDRTGLPLVLDGGRSHRYVRTPLTAALSTDGGHTWPYRKAIEDDPNVEYCYTAIHFIDGGLLLGYSDGNPTMAHLGSLRIRRLAMSWLPPIKPAALPPQPPEPTSTTQPDNTRYYSRPDLIKGCETRVAAMQSHPCDIVFIGDSITANWLNRAGWLWTSKYQARNALDFGIGGDKTQNVIWRLQHMNVTGLRPKVAVVMIGTNNLQNTVREIADGVEAVVATTRTTFPKIKVILVSILPNQRANDKMMSVDAILRDYCDGRTVHYLDLVPLMPPVGDNWLGLGPDHLHPDASGYRIWAYAMEPQLNRLLHEK